jgi:hypothetical protein
MILRSRRLLWRLISHGFLLVLLTAVASAQQFTIRKIASTVTGRRAAAGVVYAPIQQSSIGGRLTVLLSIWQAMSGSFRG